MHHAMYTKNVECVKSNEQVISHESNIICDMSD